MRLFYFFIFTVFLSHNSLANDKLFVEGNTLYYNTDLAADEINAEINWDDADLIHSILLENPNITTIQLNSSGGLIEASQYISDVVIDFELDTYVSGECSSACVDIFLAGQRRVLERGFGLDFIKGVGQQLILKDIMKGTKKRKVGRMLSNFPLGYMKTHKVKF